PNPATRAERLAALRAGAWECIAPPHDADEILLKIGAYVHAKLDADRARSEGLLDSATRLYNRQGLARRARELSPTASHAPRAPRRASRRPAGRRAVFDADTRGWPTLGMRGSSPWICWCEPRLRSVPGAPTRTRGCDASKTEAAP